MLLFGVIPTQPWDILLTPAFWWFVVLVIALIITERIIFVVARRTVIRLNLPRTAANNVMIGVRIIILVIIITGALPLFGVFIPSELLVALTASLSTAVALFISFSLQNVVAGFYILISRPFSVGDYVKIGANEGIVDEITINYTRLYGPDKVFVTLANQRVLQNDITNYRVREPLHTLPLTEKSKKKELSKGEESMPQREKRGRLGRIFSGKKLDELKHIKIEVLYRYTFTVTVRRDYYDEDRTEHKFEEICSKWKPKFGYKPTYQLWGAGGGDVPYLFAITVDDPIKLIENRNEFYKDIIRVTGPTKK
ncbi:MAG: mechanosensitive ion channel [Candidatus Jordarchaeaceae archaeon]